MKVDYHIHLEEGPYSLSFVEKSLKAIEKGVKEIATFEKRQRIMQPINQNEGFV